MAEKSATDEQLGRLARRQNEVFRRVREGSLPADFALSELQRIIEFHEAEHVEPGELGSYLLDPNVLPTLKEALLKVREARRITAGELEEELIEQERSMNDDIWEVTARAEKAETERDIYLKALERIRTLVPSDRHHKVEDVEALDLIANEVRAALNQQEEK